jgi:hypothetical protein
MVTSVSPLFRATFKNPAETASIAPTKTDRPRPDVAGGARLIERLSKSLPEEPPVLPPPIYLADPCIGLFSSTVIVFDPQLSDSSLPSGEALPGTAESNPMMQLALLHPGSLDQSSTSAPALPQEPRLSAAQIEKLNKPEVETFLKSLPFWAEETDFFLAYRHGNVDADEVYNGLASLAPELAGLPAFRAAIYRRLAPLGLRGAEVLIGGFSSEEITHLNLVSSVGMAPWSKNPRPRSNCFHNRKTTLPTNCAFKHGIPSAGLGS